jgi:hypothetical protein
MRGFRRCWWRWGEYHVRPIRPDSAPKSAGISPSQWDTGVAALSRIARPRVLPCPRLLRPTYAVAGASGGVAADAATPVRVAVLRAVLDAVAAQLGA